MGSYSSMHGERPKTTRIKFQCMFPTFQKNKSGLGFRGRMLVHSCRIVTVGKGGDVEGVAHTGLPLRRPMPHEFGGGNSGSFAVACVGLGLGVRDDVEDGVGVGVEEAFPASSTFPRDGGAAGGVEEDDDNVAEFDPDAVGRLSPFPRPPLCLPLSADAGVPVPRRTGARRALARSYTARCTVASHGSGISSSR